MLAHSFSRLSEPCLRSESILCDLRSGLRVIWGQIRGSVCSGTRAQPVLRYGLGVNWDQDSVCAGTRAQCGLGCGLSMCWDQGCMGWDVGSVWDGIRAQSGAESKVRGTGSERWSDVLVVPAGDRNAEGPHLCCPPLPAGGGTWSSRLSSDPRLPHPLFSPKGLQTTRKAKTSPPCSPCLHCGSF